MLGNYISEATREESQERRIDDRYDNLRHQIKTQEGAARFINDYEPDMAKFLSEFANGNFAQATMEIEHILDKVAKGEIL